MTPSDAVDQCLAIEPEILRPVFEAARRPGWHVAAACRLPMHVHLDFFSEVTDEVERCTAVCATCPAREPCLAVALDDRLPGVGRHRRTGPRSDERRRGWRTSDPPEALKSRTWALQPI